MDAQKILSVARDVKELKGFYDKMEGLDNSYDKVNYGFNIDSRFKASGGVEIYFGGYMGTYGSSSVYSAIDIRNQDIFNECLIEVLNENQKQIIEQVVKKMNRKCKDNLKELSARIEKLKELYDEIDKAV